MLSLAKAHKDYYLQKVGEVSPSSADTCCSTLPASRPGRHRRVGRLPRLRHPLRRRGRGAGTISLTFQSNGMRTVVHPPDRGDHRAGGFSRPGGLSAPTGLLLLTSPWVGHLDTFGC